MHQSFLLALYKKIFIINDYVHKFPGKLIYKSVQESLLCD